MALNTNILPNNKILEIEECEPISSPSSTSFEEHKTAPHINSLYSTLFKNYILPVELTIKKINPTHHFILIILMNYFMGLIIIKIFQYIVII